MKKVSLRHSLLVAAAVATTFAASAVPAKRGLRTFTQPDGTTIQLTLVGDENHHSLLTPDGLTVRADDNGRYCYVVDGEITSVTVSPEAERTEAELSLIRANASAMTFEALVEHQKANSTRQTPAQARARQNAPARRASQVPQTGSPRVPVLLVQYSDVKFKDGANANDTFVKFYEDGDKSARQYFIDQSNGHYTPIFDVYGPYTLNQRRRYYGGNDSQGYDKYVGKMVAEGCQGLDNEIDFSKYDNDGDGICDVVIVLYAGVGEADADPEVAESIWPCQWDLKSSDYRKNLTLDGVTVSKFAVFNELYSDESKLNGVGTFCHEFSHCLDLPDYYDTEYTGRYFGMGPWSLMDYGCYNDNGYTPIGYSAYEKNFMRWLELPEAVPGTHYTLTALNQKNEATDMAVRVTNDRDADEYYVLENRAKTGWDKYMAAEGLFIYHVTYSAKAWEENTVNNYSLQRMTPIPADNALKLDSYGNAQTASLKGDLWPYNKATELTDTSTPAAKVNTGGYMGKPITEITRNTDGTVSFWFVKEASGIEGVEIDGEGGACEYFNLQGVRVAAPTAPGIYLRRSADGRVSKEIIR